MNPLVLPTAAVFSAYTLAAWAKNRVISIDNSEKPSVTSGSDGRRNQAVQLCAS